MLITYFVDLHKLIKRCAKSCSKYKKRDRFTLKKLYANTNSNTSGKYIKPCCISRLLLKASDHTLKDFWNIRCTALKPYISRGITARRSLFRSKILNSYALIQRGSTRIISLSSFIAFLSHIFMYNKKKSVGSCLYLSLSRG